MEGLFICGRKDEAVPLKSLSVRAFLQGYVVGYRSTLTYENNSSSPLEVFFRTPVEDSHAVVGLEAFIDGRKIRAKIEAKETAREMYSEAISRGRTAAFGEEKKGDIFSLLLGNFPPGDKVVIELTMVGELSVEPDSSVRFVLPTILKPRYTPLGATDPLAPVIRTTSGPVHRAARTPDYKFHMVINRAADIAKVSSPTHEINVENTGGIINVSLDEDKLTDIVILIRPKETHRPLVYVEPGLLNGENYFQKSAVVMVSFFPDLKGDSSCMQNAAEFVFVIDRSGSMDGAYIKDAAKTLLLFLKSIPEGCYFNVIGFGSTYEKLFPKSMPYNQDNLDKAVKHAENLQADLGGTEMLDPLKYVFSRAPIKRRPRQVFVLTDGSVSNTESVIQLVAKNSNNSRCFSFGIGSGASTALVNGIAEAGKGAAEFISTGERMQAKVIRSLKKAMQPAVTNTQVSFTLSDDVTVTSIPSSSLPAIFIGERLIVYGILYQSSHPANTQEGSIRLTGDLLGAKIEHNMKFRVPFPVTKDSVLQVSTVHHLAAKKLIKEMESDDHESFTNSIEIIQLSCDSNVISSRTAFIAIDEERKEAVSGSLQTWDILPEEDFLCGSVPYISLCSAPIAPVIECFSLPCCMDEDFSDSAENFSEEWNEYDAPGIKISSSRPLPAKRKYLPRSERSPEASLGIVFPLKDRLSTVINLQLATGAWRLTADLADVIEKTLAEVKDACPLSCEGKVEMIWATIIALFYLQLRQSNAEDEWELVAEKAEAWLTKQELPKGFSMRGLSEKASAFLS